VLNQSEIFKFMPHAMFNQPERLEYITFARQNIRKCLDPGIQNTSLGNSACVEGELPKASPAFA
jgi:hypothetical protein